MNHHKTFREEESRMARIRQYWREVDEENDYYAARQNTQATGNATNARQDDNTPAEVNIAEIKEFITECEQTLKRLRRAGAKKDQLDSLKELVKLYKEELKNKDGSFDYGVTDAVAQFKRKVISEEVQESIMQDLFDLDKLYPEESMMLYRLTNWLDWSIVDPLPMRQIQALPHVELTLELKIPEYIQDPFYYSRRLEPRETWRKMSVKDIITKKLGLTYKDVKQKFYEKNGYHDDFDAWIKKSIIVDDWTNLDDEVPSIFDINVTTHKEKDMGVMKDIPYIEAYSFNMAFAEAGRQGLVANADQPFYWVTKIGGTARKYRYNFASNKAYSNLLFAKRRIARKKPPVNEQWFNQDFYDEMLAITGEKGRVQYDKVMKIKDWKDKLLSDECVVFIAMAQSGFSSEVERQKEIARRESSQQKLDKLTNTNTESDGVLNNDFFDWMYHYRVQKAMSDERMRIEREAKEKEEKIKADRLYKYGEDIGDGYRRYVREGRTLEIKREDYFAILVSIQKDESGWFFDEVVEQDPKIKKRQDIFFMFTLAERLRAMKFFANAYYLNEDEEWALIYMLKNTPPSQQDGLSKALDQNDLYKNLLGQVNENDQTVKQFLMQTEEIRGHVDYTYMYDAYTDKDAQAIARMTPRQVQASSVERYKTGLEDMYANIEMKLHQDALINLLCNAGSNQLDTLKVFLGANDLKRFIAIKQHLSEEKWNKLMGGKGEEDRGLEQVLAGDKLFAKYVENVIWGHTSVSDTEKVYSVVPRSVIKMLGFNAKAEMLRQIANGWEETPEDERTMINILQACVESMDKAKKQEFYNALVDNGAAEDMRWGTNSGNNYSKLEQLLSSLNTAGRSSRIAKADKASASDLDFEAANMSDGDMASLSWERRKNYLNKLVGVGGWEEFWTSVGDRDEDTIIRLMNTVPHDQVKKLYDYLYTNSGERFLAFNQAIHGAEYKEFFDKLAERNREYVRVLLMNNPAKMEAYNRERAMMELKGHEHEKGIKFSDPGSVKLAFSDLKRTGYSLVFTPTGELQLFYFEQSNSGFSGFKYIVFKDPMQLVAIDFIRADSDLGVEAGEVWVVPAVQLFYLDNKQTNQRWLELLDAVFLALSIASFGTASTVWAAFDLALATGNIIMRNYKDDLPDSIGHAWDELNKAVLVYAAFRFGPQLLASGIKKARDLIKGIRTQLGKLTGKLKQLMTQNLQAQEKMVELAEKINIAKTADELAALRAEITASKLSQEAKNNILTTLDQKLADIKALEKSDEVANALKAEELARKEQAAKELAQKEKEAEELAKQQEADELARKQREAEDLKKQQEADELARKEKEAEELKKQQEADELARKQKEADELAAELATFSPEERTLLQDFRTRYPNSNATNSEVVQLIRKMDSPAQFNELLMKTDADVQRLNKLIDIVSQPNISKLDELLQIASGDKERFRIIVDRIDSFTLTDVPAGLSPPANLYGYSGANMKHFAERHIDNYFIFNSKNIKAENTMWPRGTTIDDVRKYLQETLDILHPHVVLPDIVNAQTCTLANGMIVKIATNLDDSGGYVINMFHPVGPLNDALGIYNFTQPEMRAIRTIVK